MEYPDPASKQSAYLYDIYLLLCIQYYTPDDGQKTCPKHVEFYSKNRFEESVHLVGFIMKILCGKIVKEHFVLLDPGRWDRQVVPKRR